MINNLAKTITDKLVSNNAITKDEYELYIYGLFMLISQLMYFFITLIFGFAFSCVIQSIIFYISFQLIRKFAGGYHASTELKCEVLTTLSILLCIIIIKLSETYDFQTVLLVISTMAAICIFCLCPLDTPEKPLSDKEFKYFRKVSWLILLVIVVSILVSYVFKFQIITVPCCLSLILESILLVVGKIKKVSQTNNVKT